VRNPRRREAAAVPFLLATGIAALLSGCTASTANGRAPAPTARSGRTEAAATGAVRVAVSGLPDGVAAAIELHDSAGSSRFVPSSVILRGLLPGRYALEASRIRASGVTFVPQPATQVLDVVAGAEPLATVRYQAASNPAPRDTVAAPVLFRPREMVVLGQHFRYRVFFPRGYAPSSKWPVVLFIHGAGERGVNNTSQLDVGLGPYLRSNAATFPAIVVFPQLPAVPGTAAGSALLDSLVKTALHQTLAEVNADSTRIYVTGISAGAVRSYDVVYQLPDLFAASVPIAGRLCASCILGSAVKTADEADTVVAVRLRSLPIWIFHGARDTSVPPADDRRLLRAFRASGLAVRYTEYADLGHESWDRTYANPALWAWLFAQHR